jgi:hypothetical protein
MLVGGWSKATAFCSQIQGVSSYLSGKRRLEALIRFFLGFLKIIIAVILCLALVIHR